MLLRIVAAVACSFLVSCNSRAGRQEVPSPPAADVQLLGGFYGRSGATWISVTPGARLTVEAEGVYCGDRSAYKIDTSGTRVCFYDTRGIGRFSHAIVMGASLAMAEFTLRDAIPFALLDDGGRPIH